MTYVWRCGVCNGRITSKKSDRGVILFSDPTTGGYPQWSNGDEHRAQVEYALKMRAFDEDHASPSGLTVFTLKDLEEAPEFPERCRIRVVHLRCDNRPDKNEYWLSAEETTGDALLNSIAHLLGKAWFGEAEARNLIYHYLSNR